MKMGNFDFAGFSFDAGYDEMFVVNAKKHSSKETVELCKREYEHRFSGRCRLKWEKKLREPTVEDVQPCHCAFRFGVSDDWPDGCYTLVGKNDVGAFPVWVIDFRQLEMETLKEKEESK